MTSTDNAPIPDETQKALEIARSLIKAGVPVFAAGPCPEGCPKTDRKGNAHKGGPGKYHLPGQWEKTIPSEVWLDPNTPNGWRPGWALAAVGGHVVDFLDGDPRNGGEESLRQLHGEGIFPLTFGQQKTPSDGDHWAIAATGLRKATGELGGFLPGLDLQSGDASGQGRGFVWIAPTVRMSKTTGELVAYRWEVEPDLELMTEQIEDARDSVAGLVSLIEGNRANRAPKQRESAPAAAYDPNDPFMTPGMAAGMVFGSDRSFTLAEAQEFVGPTLLALRAAPVGQIEEHANTAATMLSHFVPAFWSVQMAMAILTDNLKATAYDPNGPSDWTVDKFEDVLDGTRPPADPWKAARKPDPVEAPPVMVETAPGEESLTTLEKLRRKLITAQELSELPAPEPLVHGLLNLDTETWVIGAAGSLKSFVMLDIAGHVAAGRSWQGHRVERHTVLYLAAEGQRGMVLRTRAWLKVHGSMDGVVFLPYPVQVKSSDGQWDALVQIAAELAPGLVVIDTQHRVSTGLEENSATDMGILISAIGRLKRATGACVAVVHHTGRNGGDARGSSALDGAQDTELKVERAEPRESLICTLKQDKQKDMAEGSGRGIPLAMKVIDLGIGPHAEPLSSLVVDPQADAVDRAMRTREGFSEAELEPFRGLPTEEWTKHVEGIAATAKVQRFILQVLADHAHDLGLTESKAKAAVTARWYGTDDKGKRRAPDSASWVDSWSRVVSSPIAVRIGGERWALDQALLSALKAEFPQLTPDS